MSGIFGVYSMNGESVADELLMGTIALQHKGEEGCGISFPKNDGFYTPKAKKLAYYFFRDEFNGLKDLRERAPSAAIGHTLYEDTGGLQPVEQWGETHILSLAMDGVLLGFGGKNDSVVRTLFSKYLDETQNYYLAIEMLMKKLKDHGSYCVVALVKREKEVDLIAFRDPKGIKPLCLGEKRIGDRVKYIISSETKGLDAVEATFIKDIEPGEIVIITKEDLKSKKLIDERHCHCFFDWIYFADPTSVIEGRNVYEVRKELGRRLARRHINRVGDIDLVIASPDTGRGVAIGFQQELCKLTGRFIPYEEASVKNPGAKRTFQVENEEERRLAANVKFFMNEDLVKGKVVAVGDDSIVRGTVFRDGMIYKLRRAGAKKIYPVISCPALLHSCIKDPGGKNFAAFGLNGSVEEIGEAVAGKLNADFVCYPTTQDMIEAIGFDDLCKACIDGNFPVDEKFWR
jgi:amidophosphoribosyltransferase